MLNLCRCEVPGRFLSLEKQSWALQHGLIGGALALQHGLSGEALALQHGLIG